METNRLLQYQVLAKTGNLREAAIYLGISHPGLSKSIHALEDELGIRLITKDGRGIKITNEGKKLLQNIKDCLEAERKLLLSAKGIEKSLPTEIRIGTFEVFSTYLSPSLVRSLGSEVCVTFAELIPGKLEESLSSGQVDIGITYLPVPTSNVEHFEITKIQMGLFTGQTAEWKNFEEIPFVVPISQVEGSPTKVRGLDGWPDDRIPRNVQYSVSMMETAISLSRDGLAAAYLPKFVAELHNRSIQSKFALKELPLPKKILNSQAIFVAKNKASNENKYLKSVCKVLRGLK